MRIISYNVNGIRAAMKKGFIDWIKTNPADIVCLQETKATKDDVDIKQLEALGFHHYWYSAFHPESILTEHGHAMLKNFLVR